MKQLNPSSIVCVPIHLAIAGNTLEILNFRSMLLFYITFAKRGTTMLIMFKWEFVRTSMPAIEESEAFSSLPRDLTRPISCVRSSRLQTLITSLYIRREKLDAQALALAIIP